jgi:hypothetical protein
VTTAYVWALKPELEEAVGGKAEATKRSGERSGDTIEGGLHGQPNGNGHSNGSGRHFSRPSAAVEPASSSSSSEGGVGVVGVADTYRQLYRVLSLKPVQWLTLILLTSKVRPKSVILSDRYSRVFFLNCFNV